MTWPFLSPPAFRFFSPRAVEKIRQLTASGNTRVKQLIRPNHRQQETTKSFQKGTEIPSFPRCSWVEEPQFPAVALLPVLVEIDQGGQQPPVARGVVRVTEISSERPAIPTGKWEKHDRIRSRKIPVHIWVALGHESYTHTITYICVCWF